MQEPFQRQKCLSKVIFSPTKQPSQTAILCHVTRKLGNSNVLYCKTKKPIMLNICKMSSKCQQLPNIDALILTYFSGYQTVINLHCFAMSETGSVAMKTVLCILVVVDIVGNSLVCLIIKRYRHMRYVVSVSFFYLYMFHA